MEPGLCWAGMPVMSSHPPPPFPVCPLSGFPPFLQPTSGGTAGRRGRTLVTGGPLTPASPHPAAPVPKRLHGGHQLRDQRFQEQAPPRGVPTRGRALWLLCLHEAPAPLQVPQLGKVLCTHSLGSPWFYKHLRRNLAEIAPPPFMGRHQSSETGSQSHGHVNKTQQGRRQAPGSHCL